MACRLATRRGKIPRRRAGELLAAEIDERAQRQAHDAGGAALQPVYEGVFRILQSVSAGLVPSPSRIGVRLHLVLRERAEGQARAVDKGAALPCMRVDDAKAAMHGVARSKDRYAKAVSAFWSLPRMRPSIATVVSAPTIRVFRFRSCLRRADKAVKRAKALRAANRATMAGPVSPGARSSATGTGRTVTGHAKA